MTAPTRDTEPDATQSGTAPTTSGRKRRRKPTTGRSIVISLAAGLAAAPGTVGLTGDDAIDVVQRFAIVGVTTFLGSHAHRWAWLVTGAAIALTLREIPLFVAIVGLGIAVGATRRNRRAKDIGALSVGTVMCALFWSAGHNIGWPTVVVAVASVVTLIASGFPHLRRHHRKWFGLGLAVTAVLVVVMAVVAGIALALAAGDVNTGSGAARTALDQVRGGDTEAAQAQLEIATTHLGKAKRSLRMFTSPVRVVPGVAQQFNAVNTSVKQASLITEAAATLTTTDYRNLRYEGRIDLAQVKALQEPATKVAAVLGAAEADLTSVQSTWLLPPLATRVGAFSGEVATARAESDLAAQALDVLPGLLGDGTVKRYAVMFITPAEIRGGGGFIGSWAELTAADGKVSLSRSGRIAELINAKPPGTRTLTGPEDYVRRYGRLDPQDFLQDVPYSPNWPSNAAVFANLYEQSTGTRVDGVIGVDPKGLSALLQLTGPVTVEGLPFPLNSTNAVQLLTRQQYLDYGQRSEREEVLAAATKATFQALVDASLPAPRQLGEVLGPAARGRHIQLWSPEETEEALFQTIHADSALVIPAGADGFTVVQQNIGNNKLDAYLQRSVAYDITVNAADGSYQGTLTVALDNQNTDLTLPDAVVANLRGAPRGTNVASVSVYGPWTVDSATIDGEPDILGRDEEVGLRVWDTPALLVPPGGTTKLVLKISGSADLSDGYRLRIVPQPVAQADLMDVRVRISGGRFGTPDGDIGGLEINSNAKEMHLSGRLDRTVDLSVPAKR